MILSCDKDNKEAIKDAERIMGTHIGLGVKESMSRVVVFKLQLGEGVKTNQGKGVTGYGRENPL